jgi:predicted GNAT family acetyltransferase
VERAILFTAHDNVAAQNAYEALGFRRIGDYGLLILDDPVQI